MKNKAASRLLLDMNRWGIDVFDEFGRYDYVNTQTILPTHTHPGMIEICYLAKGSQKYFVGDRKYRLYGGDLFVTFPDEVHGTGEVPEEKGVLYWLVLKRPEAGKDYMGLDYADACSLFAKLSELPERQFKGGAECGCLLRKIVQLFYSDRDELAKMELENLLVSFLLVVVRAGQHAHMRIYSKRMVGMMEYIEKNLSKTIDLDKLADKCNLSLSRFKHLFKEETGIPPSEYIMRKKMECAQALLEAQGAIVKDIAYGLGFSSPAYFSTVFKQYNGCSPTEYLKNKKGKKE